MDFPVVQAQVGEWHRVRCIRIPEGWHAREAQWWPVLGAPHRDPEIGADWIHIHVDWRFVKPKLYERAIRSTLSLKPHGQVVNTPFEMCGGKPVFALRRRKCWREMPDFPARPAKFALLEEAHAQRCARLVNGTHCPHRGIDLRPFAKPDGTAVCPGHGLRWDLRTGELLRHHRDAEARLL